ncbi:MAG: hypothetical protein ACK42D_02660 [Candidatus Paceibacteria bacterium]
MTNLKYKIIEKIKAGQVAMKPKWYFVLQTFLWVASLLLVAMIAVYLLSFVFFVLYRSGLWYAPSFGWSGLVFFVVSWPWLLIILVGFFLLLLYLLVTHFAFSYKKPLVYSLLGVVLFVIGISSFIQYTMIHDRIHSFSVRHQLPGFSPLYRDIQERRPEGMVVGAVTQITENGFIMSTERNGLETVLITNRTKHRNDKYTIGDRVIVFGKKSGVGIEAFGIRLHDESIPSFLPPRPNQNTLSPGQSDQRLRFRDEI